MSKFLKSTARLILTLFMFCILAIISTPSIVWAQKAVQFNDIVVKIKEDDDGKLIVLEKAKQILYLKFDSKNYDAYFNSLSNSQSYKSKIKISTDNQLNVISVESLR